jgi:hypothetical protein
VVTESIDQYLAEEDLDETQPTVKAVPSTDDQLTKALSVLKAKAA